MFYECSVGSLSSEFLISKENPPSGSEKWLVLKEYPQNLVPQRWHWGSGDIEWSWVLRTLASESDMGEALEEYLFNRLNYN